MMPGLREKTVSFMRRFPTVSSTLLRFPVPDTFWNAGFGKIFLRFANHYLTTRQMRAAKSRVYGYPSHLYIDPTNVCTLRCPVCPTGTGAPGRPKGRMALATFRKIIDETGRYLVSIDFFNWGEPLLHRDIFEMVEYAHRLHIVTSISTNFNHFSEQAAEEMISSGLDVLILSIDGASRESYREYRVGGDFDKVIDNIRLLVSKKRKAGVNHPYIYWQFLIMRHNEHERETARQLAERLGVDEISFGHAFLPVATRDEAMKWLPRDPKNHRYNLEELEKVWAARETLPESSVGTAMAPQESAPGGMHRRRPRCSWLWTQATINWDGSISPCCAVYDPSDDFGNVSAEPFRKAWNNENYRASRRFSSKGEVGRTVTVCMRCPLAAY
jgi:radical SAM protein with 4Fe4S-binding SPASM domain